VPVGAVVVKDGKIIAKAHNRVESLRDPTAHAELLAIKKSPKKAKPKISSWLHHVCFFGTVRYVCLRIGFSPYR